LSGIFGQVLGLTVFFTPWLLLVIFLIALAAEFGIMIPFLMESVWLFSGYNVAIGIFPPLYLVLLCAVSMMGREAGSSAVFHISWFGSPPLSMLYRKYLHPKLSEIFNRSNFLKKISTILISIVKRISQHYSAPVLCDEDNNRSVKLLGRPFRLTPFTVALGRLLWLRLPITIATGATGQRKSLLWGVVIFSIIWDGVYIIIGTLGGRAGLAPIQMFLYPLAAMIVLMSIAFIFRRLRRPVALSRA